MLDLANQEVYLERILGFRGLQVGHHDVRASKVKSFDLIAAGYRSSSLYWPYRLLLRLFHVVPVGLFGAAMLDEVAGDEHFDMAFYQF